MIKQAILEGLDQIAADLEDRNQLKAAQLIDQASYLIIASDEQIEPQVDELASLLRSKLNGLSYEVSLKIAADLVTNYGEYTDDEKEAALPFNNKERKQGPDPASSGLYQPGVYQWWAQNNY